MQQMASDIFVRILRGMGACRKKPAQPASGSQLDDSIGNTPTTVSWRVWGYEVGLGWRLASSGISLPNNVFSWLLSDFTGPFSRPKNPSKTCAPQGASPVVVWQMHFCHLQGSKTIPPWNSNFWACSILRSTGSELKDLRGCFHAGENFDGRLRTFTAPKIFEL